MAENYMEYLERELQRAKEEFEEAKNASVKAIQNMDVNRAVEYGAAYASHIDKITSAAAAIRLAEKAIRAYEHYGR